MRSILVKISAYLLIFFFLVLVIIIGEFFAQRFLGLGNPMVYEKSILWGYSPAPNQKVKRFRNSFITIDNVGTRSLNEWHTSDLSKSKLVFFGDSVTFGGSYIDDNDLFSEKVCQLKTSFKCFNAGVNSYGALNIIARSRFDTRLEDSNIRIYILNTGDFFRGLQDHETAHFIMHDNLGLLPAIYEILNYLSARYSFKNFLGKNKGIPDPISLEQARINSIEWGLDLLKVELLRLNELDIYTRLYLTPSKYEFEKGKHKKYSIHLLDYSKKIGLKVDPFLPFFIDSGLSKEEIYYDEIHLEREGHRIVSQFISSDL